MKIVHTLIFSAFILPSICGATEYKPDGFILCKHDGSLRTLHSSVGESGCMAYYSKEGEQTKIAESKSKDYCRSVLSTVKATLEASNWKCRSTAKSTVHNVDEKVTR